RPAATAPRRARRLRRRERAPPPRRPVRATAGTCPSRTASRRSWPASTATSGRVRRRRGRARAATGTGAAAAAIAARDATPGGVGGADAPARLHGDAPVGDPLDAAALGLARRHRAHARRALG